MAGWVGRLVDGWMGGWVDRWMGGWVGGWVDGWVGGWSRRRNRTGVIGIKGWVGERLVGGVDGWVVGWVGGIGGCVGGWAKGSHTSLDQPCLGLTWLVKGNSTLPPPPIRPLGSFVP